MQIRDVVRKTGVTERALRYYDQIGLLRPARVTQSGYREYDEDNLSTLQQILFFREMDIPLEDISRILSDPAYDKTETLRKHRELLMLKKQRLEDVIRLLDDTIKGGKPMSFDAFDTKKVEQARKQYAEEAKQRYGDTKEYKQSQQKTAAYGDDQWQQFDQEGLDIIKAFADCRAQMPEGEQAQTLVKNWQAYITARFYECKKPILSCLGQMYTGDERFTQFIDQAGQGTAAFMSKAIEVYCR